MAAHLQALLDQARVAPEIFKLRPDYRALLIAIDGISPSASDSTSEAMLQEAEELARNGKPVAVIPHVLAWREAYKAFGAKPAKFKNSLEALTRRIGPESELPRVNRLTDIYNAISVKHQIPFGGEDLDKYDRAPFLTRATGNETFKATANGATVTEQPDVGEVVWCDDTGVTCRRWNWRQGPRTALSDETTRVLFVLDVLKPISDAAMQTAADELVAALKKSSADLLVAQRIIRAPEES